MNSQFVFLDTAFPLNGVNELSMLIVTQFLVKHANAITSYWRFLMNTSTDLNTPPRILYTVYTIN